MKICMSNGGVYPNVTKIADVDISAETSEASIINILNTSNFIVIEFRNGGIKKSLIKTDCISSINFFN